MAHEDLKRSEHVDSSSDRSFGFVFAAVFAIISVWPLLFGRAPRWWAIGVAAAFAVAATLRPGLLAQLNRAWTKFGILLSKVVSPIALGVLFFVVFAPLGAVVRVLGKDPLRLKRDPVATSYWISREPPGPPPASMDNQF